MTDDKQAAPRVWLISWNDDPDETVVVLEGPDISLREGELKVTELSYCKRIEAELCDKVKAQGEVVKVLRNLLKEIRSNSSLRKSPGAGGQDRYAGLPPMMRLIDQALAEADKLERK